MLAIKFSLYVLILYKNYLLKCVKKVSADVKE